MKKTDTTKTVQQLKRQGFKNAEIARRTGLTRAGVGHILKRVLATKCAPTGIEDAVAQEILGPVITYVAKNRGAAVWLADELTRLVGTLQGPSNVRQWLNPDPARRVACRLGIGLLLRRIFDEKVGGKKQKST